jgi:hypothetical protein
VITGCNDRSRHQGIGNGHYAAAVSGQFDSPKKKAPAREPVQV